MFASGIELIFCTLGMLIPFQSVRMELLLVEELCWVRFAPI
jgi:hypothetical protein